jgi:hypothetical protein
MVQRAFLFLRSDHPARVKLAPHRSMTFWSGLLVMGFVCWAWWDSLHHDTWLTTRHFSCSHVAGAVSLTLYQVNFGPSSGRGDISQHASFSPAFAAFTLAADNSIASPPTAQMNSGERLRFLLSSVPSGAHCSLNLPHWLILMAVAPVWLRLLFWRARRRRKAAVVA